MTGWLQRLLWVWERLQVELNGQYSRKRLQAFQNFRQRVSLVQAVTVVLVTPLPCLLIVVAADAIPLQPVERGLAHSGAFWMRSLFTVGVFTIALLVQCETYIPRLSLSLWERMTIVLAVSSLAVASCYPLICLIGFPVPFSISLLSVPWLSLFVMSLWLARGRLIRTDKATRAGLQEFAYIGLTQTVTTVVYQAFYAAFSQMSPSAQTKFVLLLPVLKLVQKNATTHLMHDKDDSKPEVVTFNVELFHSMFVSCCMQRSTSKITSFVLMSVDFTQVCISLYDLNRMLSAIEALAIENRLRKEDFVAVALLIASLEPVAIARDQRSTVVTPTTPFQAAPGKTRGRIGGVQVNNFHAKKKLSPPQSMVRTAWIHPMNRVAARGATTRTVTDALSGQHKTIFVQNLLRAMFLIEFLLLIEFVEVMIPATYCVYLATIFHLPNRAFYPHLAHMTDDQLYVTAQSVLLYAAMELCSFLVLLAMIHRRLHISGLHQLAFVLNNQATRVQCQLTFWFLFVLQSTLVHLGADYSFKFAWLHTPSPPDS